MSAEFVTPERTDAWTDITDRRLKAETLRKYGYFKAHFGKEQKGVHVWPIYGHDGSIAHQRLRFPDKSFMVLGDSKEGVNGSQLFGRPVYGDKNDLRVVITEGELDAMSVGQATKFKIPAVSINGGASSAKKCLQANYLWLDRFKEIVLWFDDDDAGREAVAECGPLFKNGKVKLAKVQGFKDASDVLKADRPGDIEQAIYGASPWSPQGIVNAADCEDDMVFTEVPCWHYPYKGLQEFTKGLRRAEMSFWVAGAGIGKTTILYAIANHLLNGTGHTESPAKIGWLGFEGTRRDVILGFASIHAQRRLHIDPLPEDKMRALHKAVFAKRDLELFDQETASWTFPAVIAYIRYMAKALDCSIVVVDPMSFLVALMGEADERKAIDKATAELSMLAKELGIHIAINHHLTRPKDGKSHEEGGRTSLAQLRGSGGLGAFTSQAVGFERNQQHDNPEAATLTRVRVLKNRFAGRDGVCCYLQYDAVSGLTYEIPFADGQALWGDDKDGGKGGGSPFSKEDDY